MRYLLSAAAVAMLSTAAFAQTAPEYAKPGTELKAGEMAVVPHLIPKGPEVPIELTITSIEKGTDADIAGFTKPPEMADYEPTLVHYSYKNVSDQDLSNQTIGAFVAIDDRNQEQRAVTTTGGLLECRQGTAPNMTPGATGEGCLLYMIHKDGALKAIAYKGHTKGDNIKVDYPIYFDPIRWVPADAAPAEAPAAGGAIVPTN